MQDLVLLHGALGCSAHWTHILPHLDRHFRIHNLDFPWHGHTAGIKKDLTLADLADFVSEYVEQYQLHDFSIAGYSMGGYVGLELIRRRINGLQHLLTLGTKLAWSPELAEHEISRISIDSLQPIHQKLQTEHGEHWMDVIAATHTIMRSIGRDPLRKELFEDCRVKVNMFVGEKDKMVTYSETESFCNGRTNFECEVLPAQPHLLERVDAILFAGKINTLLKNGQEESQ